MCDKLLAIMETTEGKERLATLYSLAVKANFSNQEDVETLSIAIDEVSFLLDKEEVHGQLSFQL